MSLFQKAIRRGERSWALAAAATLLIDAPDKFWRRLAGTAVEDVALADISATGAIVCMMAGKKVRASGGGEWKVAAWLTERLVYARKVRATDDLLIGLQLLPSLEAERWRLAELTSESLREIVIRNGNLYLRAMALLYLAGNAGKPLSHLKSRSAEHKIAFEVLDQIGTPLTVLELAREGYRVNREPLWLLMALLATEPGGVRLTADFDDIMPTENMVGVVPAWAVDGFTREGNLAIGRFLQGASPYVTWLKANIEHSRHHTITTRTLFRVEGSLSRMRRESELIASLRSVNERETLGLPSELAGEAMRRLRDDLPRLDAIRASIMERQAHV
jgi:hypothetical protein